MSAGSEGKPFSTDLLLHSIARSDTPSGAVHGCLTDGLAAVHRHIVSCEQCPRLRHYCRRIAVEKKRAHRDDVYWGRPVPGFGSPRARLLIVGLAPAAHGANRTGRVFTGDGSGDFLMSALYRTGFANIPTSQRADDGLILFDAYIVAAVRCAPPGNKPLPEEIARCIGHLDAELNELSEVQVVIALGKVAFDAWLQLMKRRGMSLRPKPMFRHGAIVKVGKDLPTLLGCYHPSRQNTNTGKLTNEMIEGVFRKARRLLDRGSG
jgi:uracil-DNA glycosylase